MSYFDRRGQFIPPPKKYLHCKIIATAICIRGSIYLHETWKYNIIKQDTTKYLIKFPSGAAYWYSKDRFTNPQLVI